MNYTYVDGFVTSRETEIPTCWKGDVVVCGGGPAGIGAAIAAARSGKKTLLIEKYGFIGGMCSFGSGMPLGGAYPAYKSIGGIAEEVLTRIRESGPEAADVRDMEHFGLWYFHDSEYFKHLAFDLVVTSGVDMLLHTMVEDVVMAGTELRGIVVVSKEGRQVVLADAFVDCTGDADVAWLAGAPFELGRDVDNALMAVTIPCIYCDVDMARVKAYVKDDPGFERALAKARADGLEISREDRFLSWHRGMRPNTFFSNIVRVRNIDATKNADITRGEVEARKRLYQHLAFFRGYVPGFEKAYIGKSGEQIGIRDTRRIIGQEILTADDCRSFRKRSDGVLRCAGPFDNLTRGNEFNTLEAVSDAYDYYDIAYGMLVPQRVDNLLVAGRCFSADYLAQAGSRGMGLLIGMGQAAGNGAVMVCETGCRAAEVDVVQLRERLTGQGMVL